MAHRLDPLLRPRSIAVLGASEREGTVGRHTIENLLKGGYEGGLYAINPGRQSVLGVPCYPSLAALPVPVEHVMFAIADTRVEAALDEVIAHGARAATIMSALVIEGDTDPPLRERVLAKIRKSGLPVCGANGMGFYNFADGVWGCGFRTRSHRRGGNVAYISHSGSGMCGIVDSEERIDFNLVVSTGQELAVSMDEYLEFALEMPGTRAVGLFMETARNPGGLVKALAKARERGIPVVALKVGRTELSAKLTVSHSGAIAGEDGVYDAIFDRYGVHRVRDMDELATSLILFAQPHPLGAGGLVSIHDSGGERQLLIDLAHDHDVPLTQLSPASTRTLVSLLDPGLPAVNPLDAWSTGGPDFDVTMQNCFAVLMGDPQAALGAVVHDRSDGRRHLCGLPRLPARRPCGFGQARGPGRESPGHGSRPAGRRGDARGLPRARRPRDLPARRAAPVRPPRLRSPPARRAARLRGDRAREDACAARRPPALRRERRSDPARRRGPPRQRRQHRRERGFGAQGRARDWLPRRPQDRKARP